jgi:hypothetical protein
MYYYDTDARSPLRGCLDTRTSKKWLCDFFDRHRDERKWQMILEPLP